MGISYEYSGELLDYLFNKIPVWPRPPKYVGLCLANPTVGGTGANCFEVPDSNAYMRIQVNSWIELVAGRFVNADEVVFPKATGIWGIVTHFAILDSPIHGLGRLLLFGPLALSMPINAGCIPRFLANQLIASLD